MAAMLTEPLEVAVEVVVGFSAGLNAGMRMAPESLGAAAVTAAILGCKLLQAAHIALVLPYRSVWACRMAFVVVALQTACAALLLLSQRQPRQAKDNAVSVYVWVRGERGPCTRTVGRWRACPPCKHCNLHACMPPWLCAHPIMA